MQIIKIILLIILNTFHSLSLFTFNGHSPPNSYYINNLSLSQQITSSITWGNLTTNIDILYFKSGDQLGYNLTNKACSCVNTASPQTLIYTTTSIGSYIIMLRQTSGPSTNYYIDTWVSIPTWSNIISQSGIIHDNSSFHSFNIATSPCNLVINFTSSSGSFDVFLLKDSNLYTTLYLTSLNYVNNTGWKNKIVNISLAGNYYIKVRDNPAHPSSGWGTVFLPYQGTAQCRPCTDFIFGCFKCSNSSICTQCQTGYLLSGGQCLCNIPNCLNCTNGTACSTCNISTFLNPNLTCSFCASSIPNCVNCSLDGLTCYDCRNSTYILQNNQCYNCFLQIPNCLVCNTTTDCDVCNIKYFEKFDNLTNQTYCESCQLNYVGCLTCIDQTFCLTPISDQYLVYSNGTVERCNFSLTGCLRCQNQSMCTSCQLNYLKNNGQCLQCQSLINHCKICANMTHCQTCQSQYVLSSNGSCTCKFGFYVIYGCTKIYGCIRTLKVANDQVCILCDSNNNFIYNPTTHYCDCVLGYEFNIDQCVEKCGNAIHVHQECDDGNRANFDGCDQKCKIQSDYICLGTSHNRSHCYLNKQFVFQYLYTQRVDGQNKGKIYISVNPPDKRLGNLYLQQFISLSDSKINKSMIFSYSNGRIQILFDYDQQCVDQKFSISLDFSDKIYQSQPFILNFTTHQMRPKLKIIYDQFLFMVSFYIGQICAYSFLGFFFLSIILHKMIGLQTILVYQNVILLGLLADNEEHIFRIFTALQPIFGFFDIMQGSQISLISPQKYRYLVDNRSVMINCAIGILLLSISLFIYLIIRLYHFKNQYYYQKYINLSKKVRFKNNQNDNMTKQQIQLEKLQLKDKIYKSNSYLKKYYQRILFPIGILFLNPLIISNVINIMAVNEGEDQFYQYVSKIILVFMTFVVLAITIFQLRNIWISYQRPNLTLTFSPITDSIKPKVLNKYTSVFLIQNLLFIGLILIGLQISKLAAVILLTILTLFYTIYIWNLSPYRHQFHKKALVFNNLSIFAQLINVSIDHWSQINQNIYLVLILITLVLGQASVIVGFVRLYIDQKASNYLQIQKKLNQEENSKKQKQNKKEVIKNNRFLYKPNNQNQLFKKNQTQKQQKQKIQNFRQRLRRQYKQIKQDPQQKKQQKKEMNQKLQKSKIKKKRKNVQIQQI